MAITYRSTIAERRVVTEQTDDGRERIAIAERDGSVWKCKLTHPNGDTWSETFRGSGNEVVGALGNWMESKRNEFKRAATNGDRQPYRITETTIALSPNDPRYLRG